MKKLMMILVLLVCVNVLCAQNTETETVIRLLEQQEVQAILAKDSATLLKLWDANYTVNSPDNVVYFAGKSTLDRPVLKRARTTFTREIEHMIISGGIAISMGSETVIPAGDQPQTGQLVKRRFTNIWQQQKEGWKLIARHANVICKPN